MHGRQWRPMAPALTVTKGEFSFLIALGKQLERALELELDGSAPDFVSDALGVLQNALEGVSGSHLGAQEDNREPDDVSGADINPTGRLRLPVDERDAGGHRSRLVVDGATRGLTRDDVCRPQLDPGQKARGAIVRDVPRGTRKGGKRRAKTRK